MTGHAGNLRAGACRLLDLLPVFPRPFRRSLAALAALLLAGSALAASNVVEYTYDPAGNITQIKRHIVPGFGITSFDPTSGAVDTVVTIYGMGFSRIRDVVKRFFGLGTSETTVRRVLAAAAPAHRGVGAARQSGPGAEEKPPMPPHVAMNWARRLKRVFGIEIETCAGCGGRLRIIASIEDAEVIARILSHLERMASDREPPQLPLRARAPPSQPKLL